MGFCGSVRRANNSRKTKTAVAPRRAPKNMAYSHAHIVSAAYAKERGWGGAGAIRSDEDDILYNGNSFTAFKINDTWPKQFTVDGAHFHTVDVLRAAEGLKAGNGANMAHIIVHELAHEMGIGHDADNAVMNKNLRATRTVAQCEKDYRDLKSKVVEQLPAIKVTAGWHP